MNSRQRFHAAIERKPVDMVRIPVQPLHCETFSRAQSGSQTAAATVNMDNQTALHSGCIEYLAGLFIWCSSADSGPS